MWCLQEAQKANKKYALHMDNCKVHKSKLTLAFLKEHAIAYWKE